MFTKKNYLKEGILGENGVETGDCKQEKLKLFIAVHFSFDKIVFGYKRIIINSLFVHTILIFSS